MRYQARENLITAREKSKLYYDKKINPLEVKIGDNVFLLKGGKINSHYTGPYELLEVLGKGNVKISYKEKPTIVHINRLERSHVQVQKYINKNETKYLYFNYKKIYIYIHVKFK